MLHFSEMFKHISASSKKLVRNNADVHQIRTIGTTEVSYYRGARNAGA